MTEASTRGRVLVVDDEEDIRSALVFFLRMQRFHAVGVDSGEAALAAAEADQYDVVITDLRMQGMDGLETARALRRIHPAIQIIIISGYAPEDSRRAAEALGIVGILRKPFELPDIVALVESAMSQKT
jgi:CheY-like chemotaxis protein